MKDIVSALGEGIVEFINIDRVMKIYKKIFIQIKKELLNCIIGLKIKF